MFLIVNSKSGIIFNIVNKTNKKPKVFVMMSGGVDSSVAALLLKKSGEYEVFGAFIKGYNIDGCQKKDAEDARRVAEHIGIPFYTIDLEKEYKKKVVDYMVEGYKKGITPNPDVMCNKEIKFGLFLEKALDLGADYVATGHYVWLRQIAFRKQHIPTPAVGIASLSPRHPLLRSGTDLSGLRDVPQSNLASPLFLLYQAKDQNKDQSYFLWTLNQEQLRYCLFPIGDYLKSEVRGIAKKAGLLTAGKKDSQGICFLGQISMKDFLKKRIKVKKGDVIMFDGKKIGTHDGVWFYTIGQRHIGIMNYESGIRGKHETKPLYVVEKNIKKNILIVAEGENNPAFYKKEIKLTNINIINPDVISLIRANKGINILARVRYRQPLASARLIIHNSKFVIQFDTPVKFAASGQSAVFYDKKGRLLGGGIII